MGVVSDFSAGLRAHGAGVRFAFSNKNYLALILIPFVLTLLLFVVGFSVFAAYGDAVLAWFWSVDPAAADGVTAALYWFFTHVVKYLLYLALLALMYFLFMVVANILASPLYDHIAGKIMSEAGLSEAGVSEAQGLSIAAVMCEELKKAGFVIVVPLAFLFLPVVGQIVSPLLAMVFLAWDFIDFSLSRERPGFRERLGFVWRRKFLMLGFGAPLLIPLVNIVLYPFAVLGASLLYRDQAPAEKSKGGAS